jgi:hypothetical protein
VTASASQSRRFSVRSGVPQGSLFILVLLLFILFINDVFSCFKSLRILLYADDLKIFFPKMRRLSLMFFPSDTSTAGCSSTWRSVRT